MHIDKYESAGVRIDKYEGVYMRVNKYNGTLLGKLYTTAITGVEEKRKKSTDEFIRDANMCPTSNTLSRIKCSDGISRYKIILPYELEHEPEDNTTDDEKSPDLIDRGGYNNSDNQSKGR